MVWNIQSLLEDVGIHSYEIWRNGSPITVSSIAPINRACFKDLSFCSSEGDDAIRAISNSSAGVILCNKRSVSTTTEAEITTDSIRNASSSEINGISNI